MPPLLSLIAAVWLWSGIVDAQASLVTEIFNNAPACALPCITPVFTNGVCSLDAIAPCVCSNITLQSELSTCVQRACVFSDQVAAVSIETSVCIDYPKESRSQDVKVTAICCLAIILPVIMLRFYARLRIVRELGWDDYMTLFAVLAHIAVSAIEIASARMGFGMHYWQIQPDTGTVLLQLFWVVQMLYILIQLLTKLSILFLLGRVISTPGFQLTVKVFASFLIFHFGVFILVDAFQCIPVDAVWDRNIRDARCVNMTTAGYVMAAFSIVEDVGILLLPVPWVMRLQMNVKSRLLVGFLFGVGSFACITSMIRMKYLIKFSSSLDSTWDNVDVVIWSIIEVFSALLCGSLPAIWPLISRLVVPGSDWQSGPSNQSKGPNDSTPSYTSRPYQTSFTELEGSDRALPLQRLDSRRVPVKSSPPLSDHEHEFGHKGEHGADRSFDTVSIV
ncbi:integral membrane protein [Thozetella sp. PMI_491]|nr:integral membrane protein [Thozetella sp. PMI_491]